MINGTKSPAKNKAGNFIRLNASLDLAYWPVNLLRTLSPDLKMAHLAENLDRRLHIV